MPTESDVATEGLAREAIEVLRMGGGFDRGLRRCLQWDEHQLIAPRGEDRNMPLYEYTCTVCSNTFEKLRPMIQMDNEANCPDCGSESHRQLSVFMSFSTSPGGETRAIAGGGGCCGGSAGAGCACSMTV